MTPAALRIWRETHVPGGQRTAAALLGISHYTLCRMEKGKQPIPRSIALLCHLLHFSKVREAAEAWHTAHPAASVT